MLKSTPIMCETRRKKNTDNEESNEEEDDYFQTLKVTVFIIKQLEDFPAGHDLFTPPVRLSSIPCH